MAWVGLSATRLLNDANKGTRVLEETSKNSAGQAGKDKRKKASISFSGDWWELGLSLLA